MRYHCNTEYNNYESNSPDLHCDRSFMSEFGSSSLTAEFHEFHQRQLESFHDQHLCIRDDDVYFHTNCWTMCHDDDDECYDLDSADPFVCIDRSFVSELGSSIASSEFYEWHQRQLEPCDDQYGNVRNGNLYLYAVGGIVCHADDFEYYNNASAHSCVCSDRASVSELASARTSCQFNEWYQRQLEPFYDQYQCSRHNDLYLYANGRTMRYQQNIKCDDHSTNGPNVCSDRPAVPELGSAITSCQFDQWYQRKLEPCNDQYSKQRNDNVYLYAGSRTMCERRYLKYYDH
jgi:hypothetical protein